MPNSAILPWHRKPWQQLWQAKAEQRLAHALLLVGVDGIGKARFAKAFATTVLCAEPNDSGICCGVCHSCSMIKAGLHPDLVMIEPEEEGKKIGVDAIRDLIKQVNETTLKGGFRVVIIHPASAMNMNAANALLKTLEEPAPNTLIILISNQSLRLPATILSRCQKVVFARPSHAEALQWLQQHMPDDKVDPALLLTLADGAPMKALAWLDNDMLAARNALYQGFDAITQGKMNPLQMASTWQNTDQVFVVDLLMSWLTDVLRFKLTQNPADVINADYQTEIAKQSSRLLQANLLAYVDHLQQLRSELVGSLNLNKQMVLEDLFIRWARYVSS
jgi:DNA polymerase-3 subunit delta'